jgi:restriction endonuclease S subunit
LDFIYEKANKTSSKKIAELKQLNELCLNNQKMFGDNVVKKLSDITTCKSGKRLPQGHLLQNIKSAYPYIRITDIHNNSISLDNIKYISKETKEIISKYIITTDDIYITIAGTTGLVGTIPDELNGANLTENSVRINIINKSEILQKYLVYEIHYNQQKELKTRTIGAAIPKLAIERLMTLQINIPSLERQKEIVAYCESNDTLIRLLEIEIENNKSQAQKFIDGIVKSKLILFEECELHSLSDTDSSSSEIVVSPKSSSKDTKSRRMIKSL